MQVVENRALAPFGRREAAIAGIGRDLESLRGTLLAGKHRLPQGHLLVQELLLQRSQCLRVGSRRNRCRRISGLADEGHELLRHVLARLHEQQGRTHESIAVVRSLLRHGQFLLCR